MVAKQLLAQWGQLAVCFVYIQNHVDMREGCVQDTLGRHGIFTNEHFFEGRWEVMPSRAKHGVHLVQ